MDALSEVDNRLRIRISPQQAEVFATYRDVLISEGSKGGLTSLKDPTAIEQRHFGESLVLLRALANAGLLASPAIDIGTGAGFPGLPIKIAKPELELTLVEASGRKVSFLKQVVHKLSLNGVSVVQSRAEDLAHDSSHRAVYGLALARAVAPLRVLLELSLPFLRLGGHLATPKGSGATREIREAATALRECGGDVSHVQNLDLPWPGPTPTLVVITKVADTPNRYPRRSGIPKKRPL